MRRLWVAVGALVLWGCGESEVSGWSSEVAKVAAPEPVLPDVPPGPGGPTGAPSAGGPVLMDDPGTVLVDTRFRAKGCPQIYADGLQRIDVTMEPSLWQAMSDEFQNVEALRAAGKPVELYRDVKEVRHDGRVSTQAMIRLRGNPSYWPDQEKMQFQISFNEKDPDGRFRGLRKIVLDSAHYNASYLRDRLAMEVLRNAGVAAPCVNHAELYVNGTFYGVYANIEKVDREFLERNFEDPSSNLYKRGEILKTNEDEFPDQSRKDAFWAADSIEELEALVDVGQMVRALAAEAVFPDADGYWAGGWNFYLYDDPERGFVYIPWDIDLAFDNLPSDTDPLTWHKTNDNFNGRPHVALILSDPKWRARFVEEVEHVRAFAGGEALQSRIDAWAQEIEDAAQREVQAPWTFEYHQRAVQRLRRYVADRAEFLDAWIACQKGEGACP